MKQFSMCMLILLVTVQCTYNLYAQKHGRALIDSLQQELPKQKVDTSKVNLLNALSYGYVTLNADSGVQYGLRGLELATSLAWKQGMAIANLRIGRNYYFSNSQKSLDCYIRALNIYKELNAKKEVADIEERIGQVYNFQGNYTVALDYFLNAARIYEDAGLKNEEANLYESDCALLYIRLKDFQKALEYKFKALKIQQELGNKEAIAAYTCNIGNIYSENLKDYSAALDYYQKALRLDEESGNKVMAAVVTGNIGEIYSLSGKEYATALAYKLKSLKMHEDAGDAYVGKSTNDIGEVYLLLGDYRNGIDYMLKALMIKPDYGWATSYEYNIGAAYLALARDTTAVARAWLKPGRIKDTGIIPAGKSAILRRAIWHFSLGLSQSKKNGALSYLQTGYEHLSDTYKQAGDYKQALNYQDSSEAIKDSIFSAENNKKIIQMDLKNEYGRQRLADSIKTIAKEKVTTLLLQRQKGIIYGSLTGLALVLILSFFIFRNYNLQKKANQVIKAEKDNVEAQRNRAERSERFKQQFLANMSHEIRTPMNAVLGMTNLTLDTPLTPKQSKYLTAVKKSSENLLVIINDILELSKLEAGKMELEKIPFRLREQVAQVYDTMQFKAEEKGLILETEIAKDVPDVLIGDPSRLNQVLINLCANAIKFTEKGKVRIVVERAHGLTPALSEGEGASILSGTAPAPLERAGVRLHFSVIDQGIGIPSDKIGRLFESFQQVDASTSRKYGGTGLGLSISKTLVELQGGKMEVKSEEGKGSEFSFTISYGLASDKEIAELVKETKADNTSLTGIKILVAEDNEYNQIVIKDTLENLIKGVKVVIAENGKILIDKLLASDYDVILMDAQMPEMSGLEASQYIRKNLQGKKRGIPIIALTASVLNTDLNKCFDAGMNDYVPKPFTRVQLLNTLAKYYKNELLDATVEDVPEIKVESTAVQNSDKITDLTFLTDFCKGDEARMRKYIDIYLKVTPGNIEKIKKALEESNYKLMSTTVHAMKAHLNYMGMKQTRELGDRIEMCANEQKDLDELPELIGKLEIDWEKSRGELTNYIL